MFFPILLHHLIGNIRRIAQRGISSRATIGTPPSASGAVPSEIVRTGTIPRIGSYRLWYHLTPDFIISPMIAFGKCRNDKNSNKEKYCWCLTHRCLQSSRDFQYLRLKSFFMSSLKTEVLGFSQLNLWNIDLLISTDRSIIPAFHSLRL